MAHLKTKTTKDDMQQRRQWKWALVRGLYERGYNKGDVLELFRSPPAPLIKGGARGKSLLTDWMMTLPQELQADFEQQLESYQEEKKMPLLSQIETRAMRRGTELGVQQEARESVMAILEVRFEEVPEAIADTINSIDDVAFLDRLHRQAIVIPSLEEFERLLTSEQK